MVSIRRQSKTSISGSATFSSAVLLVLPALALLSILSLCACSTGAGPADCITKEDCPQGESCVEGKCIDVNPEHCPNIPCPEDFACFGGLCYPRDCHTRSCPGIGEICVDDQCLPASCLDVECPAMQACAGGMCYPEDCTTKVCPGFGEVCVGEQCEQRSCVQVSCPFGSACANGLCYPTDCDSASCGPEMVCDDTGVCVERSCVGVSCSLDEHCANGKCWPRDCSGNDCLAGEVCENNECLPAECVENRCCPPDECIASILCQEATCGEMTYVCVLTPDGWGWSASDKRCDDQDPCTESDTCNGGACIGSAISCNSPPADTCLGSTSARQYSIPGTCSGGTCNYDYVDIFCTHGCSQGACKPFTSCSLTIEPQGGDVNTVFTWSSSSNGTGCTYSEDGVDFGAVECNISFDFLGSDAGPGDHTTVLHVLDGPGGATDCQDSFHVDDATTCNIDISPSSGGLDSTFTWSSSSNGTGCTYSEDGVDFGAVECNISFDFLGSDAGNGAHTVVLYVGNGPSGPRQCSDSFSVN